MEKDLRLKRMERGLKQLELSQITGIGQTRLSLIENGWTEPTPDELKKIKAVIPGYKK